MTTIEIEVDLEEEIRSLRKSQLTDLRKEIDRLIGEGSGDVRFDHERAYDALRLLRRGCAAEALAELEHAMETSGDDVGRHLRSDDLFAPRPASEGASLCN